MAEPRVVLLSDNLADGMLPTLRDAYPQLDVRLVPFDDEVRPEYLEAEVLLRSGMSDELFRGILARSSRLAWVQVTAAGFDWIRCPELDERVTRDGMLVTRSESSYNVPIAEYVVAAIMFSAKRFGDMRQAQEAHVWDRFMAKDVGDSLVAVFGTGAIGAEVAWRCTALGARVVGVSRSGRHVEGFDEVVTPDQADPLLADADFVVLAMPLTVETENMIGEQQLRTMRSDAVLVNVGRGALVDDGALLRALREGWIGGAVLDVFREEPLGAASPFWDAPRTVVTPHTSFRSSGNVARLLNDFRVNLDLYLAGAPLRGTMKEPALGY